jgi:hypothetical protein
VNILLVPGQLIRDADQLIENHPSCSAGCRDGEDHHQGDGRNAAQPHLLQPVDGGSQEQG